MLIGAPRVRKQVDLKLYIPKYFQFVKLVLYYIEDIKIYLYCCKLFLFYHYLTHFSMYLNVF